MRRQEVEEHDSKRAVAPGMEDVKRACNHCHIMKVSRTDGREGGPTAGRPPRKSWAPSNMKAQALRLNSLLYKHCLSQIRCDQKFPCTR